MSGDLRQERDDARDGRVRIPADVERDDRILAGLTARQLALLAIPGVGLWAGYLASRSVVPLPVFAAVATPLVVVVLTLVLGRRDGLSLDRLAAAGVRYTRRPRRLVPAPDGVRAAPAWAGHDHDPLPAPLPLPAHGVDEHGAVDLGADGAAVLCATTPVSFALRTAAEKQALVGGFGRYLNSLTAPIQLVVRSEPVNLTVAITDLRDSAGGLPHPALEAAALAHADFLTELADSHDLLSRQLLLVLRDPAGEPDAGARLLRLAGDATAALTAAGVSSTVLDATAASSVIATALDPWNTPPPSGVAGSGEVIRGAQP